MIQTRDGADILNFYRYLLFFIYRIFIYVPLNFRTCKYPIIFFLISFYYYIHRLRNCIYISFNFYIFFGMPRPFRLYSPIRNFDFTLKKYEWRGSGVQNFFDISSRRTISRVNVSRTRILNFLTCNFSSNRFEWMDTQARWINNNLDKTMIVNCLGARVIRFLPRHPLLNNGYKNATVVEFCVKV